MTVRTAWVCGVVMMAGACDADEPAGFDDGDEAVELRSAQDNGVYLNGVYLNGDNGSDYVKVSELKYDGVTAQSAWLEGSQLFVRDSTGVVRSGIDMKKLKVKYDVQENGSLKKKTVKITHAQLLTPGSDVWVYDLDLKVGEGLWAPLCLDGNGQRTQAILLNDLWSPATGDRQTAGSAALTYACRGAALAKCIEWGYKPWSTAGGVSLEEFHQSCTRMVRADYCGDGISHTVNGTKIHVLDEKGVQGVDPDVTYAVEAEWGPDGAVCLNSANTRLANQNIECQIPACGSTSFSSGGILQSGRITSGL